MWRQFKGIDADAHMHEQNISGTDMWNRNTGRRILWDAVKLFGSRILTDSDQRMANGI